MKLQLKTETLRSLTNDTLAGVHGGVFSGDNTIKPHPRTDRVIQTCFCPGQKTLETTKLQTIQYPDGGQ